MSREQHDEPKKSKDKPLEVGGEAPRAEGEETIEKPKLPLFKIVPVDPKNSFDFEDVADK